jgi:hypothetical protein
VNNNILIFDAEHVGDSTGWYSVTTNSWQATSSSMSLIFIVYATNYNNDNTVLLDSILINVGQPPAVPTYYAQLNTPYSFETPVVQSPGYAFNGDGVLLNYPTRVWPSATLPFIFSGEVGIASNGTSSSPGAYNGYPGSPFILPGGGSQYVILQSGVVPATVGNTQVPYPTPTLSTSFQTVASSSSYTVSFYYSVRNYTAASYYGNTIIGNFTLKANNVPILVLQNVTANYGWVYVTSSPFTAAQAGVANSNGVVTLTFTSYAATADDHTMDLDLITISTSSISLSVGVTYTFTQPPIGSPGYWYVGNTGLAPYINTAYLPWNFSATSSAGPGVGIATATVGNPWDPEGTITPPSGASQFIYLQVAPVNGGSNPAWMSTIMTGLTIGQYYYLSFAFGTRYDSGVGVVTGATFSVVGLSL